MSFTEAQDYSWTDTMRAIHNIITAKAGAVAWTEAELGRAVGAAHYKCVTDLGWDGLTYEDVREAVSQLFLGGHIIPAFPEPGWRRA